MSTKILFTKKLSKPQQKDVEQIDYEDIPFIEVKKGKVKVQKNTEATNLIITSRKAIFAIKELNIQPEKIYVVGNSTAKKLQKRGYKIELIAENATQMVSELEKLSAQKFLYLSGNLRRNEIPEYFQNSAHQYQEKVVYHTTLAPKKTEREYQAIVFFSPSAVKSYFSINQVSDKTTIFAIGKTTAEEVYTNGTFSVKIPPKPDWKSLSEMILTEFNV